MSVHQITTYQISPITKIMKITDDTLCKYFEP